MGHPAVKLDNLSSHLNNHHLQAQARAQHVFTYAQKTHQCGSVLRWSMRYQIHADLPDVLTDGLVLSITALVFSYFINKDQCGDFSQTQHSQWQGCSLTNYPTSIWTDNRIVSEWVLNCPPCFGINVTLSRHNVMVETDSRNLAAYSPAWFYSFVYVPFRHPNLFKSFPFYPKLRIQNLIHSVYQNLTLS